MRFYAYKYVNFQLEIIKFKFNLIEQKCVLGVIGHSLV
jgi:hypothetical protein